MRLNFFAGLPKSVKVGAFDLSIQIMGAKWNPRAEEGETILGSFSYAEQLIRISPRMKTAVVAVDTVMHEIAHAIYQITALTSEDEEERIVTVMASGYVQVFRDNPDLLTWIQTTLQKKRTE